MSNGSVSIPDEPHAEQVRQIIRDEVKGALDWSQELDDVAARVAALEANGAALRGGA